MNWFWIILIAQYLILIVLNWKEINAFLFPDKWIEVEIITIGGVVVTELLPRKSLKMEADSYYFTFRKLKYFLSKEINYLKKKVPKYYYEENNPLPKDILLGETLVSSDEINEFLEGKQMLMFNSQSFEDLFNAIKVPLLIAGLGIVAFFLLRWWQTQGG